MYWVLIIIGIIGIFLIYCTKYAIDHGAKDGIDALNGSRENAIKFLALTYLTNNAFMEDIVVNKIIAKFNIGKEEVIKYAEAHREELLGEDKKEENTENKEENEEKND